MTIIPVTLEHLFSLIKSYINLYKKEGDYMRLTLRQIARMRYMILEGYTVEQIATSMKVSQATVRSYTKAERARVKKENALCY